MFDCFEKLRIAKELNPIGVRPADFGREQQDQANALQVSQTRVKINVREWLLAGFAAESPVSVIDLLHKRLPRLAGGFQNQNVPIVQVEQYILNQVTSIAGRVIRS